MGISAIGKSEPDFDTLCSFVDVLDCISLFFLVSGEPVLKLLLFRDNGVAPDAMVSQWTGVADGDVNFDDSENEWEDMPQAKASDQDKPKVQRRAGLQTQEGMDQNMSKTWGNCYGIAKFFGDKDPFTSIYRPRHVFLHVLHPIFVAPQGHDIGKFF